MKNCWECGTFGLCHDHHVVPRSKGGKRTVPLCEDCHSKVHDHVLLTIGELTRAAMQRKAKRDGQPVGGARYGKQWINKKLVDCPDEQATIDRMKELRAKSLSFEEVAKQLTAEGHRTKRGGSWYASTVRGVLLRSK